MGQQVTNLYGLPSYSQQKLFSPNYSVMAIEKFYFVPRRADSLSERDYKVYLSKAVELQDGKIENFPRLKMLGIWQMRTTESILPHITGDNQALDIIILDDDHETIADIYLQCERSGLFRRILAVDHPDTMRWLLEQDVSAPKIFTLDFLLIDNDADRDFKIAESIYRKVKEKWSTTCVIGLTNTEDQPDARQLEKIIRGAGENVLVKNKFLDVLSHFFRDRVVMHDLRIENLALQASLQEKDFQIQQLKEPLPEDSGKEYLVGETEIMRRVWREMQRVKSSRSAKIVLIEGPTGSGKKTVARAIIEDWGIKKRGLVRCGVLKAERFYDLLAENTHGAIIFDGLEALTQDMQERIIEVIDEGSFRRDGVSETEKNDVKFIFICSADDQYLRQQGKFSDAFFSRISSFRITVPPLCQRKEDIGDLVLYFKDLWLLEYPPAKVFLVPSDAIRYLSYYDFPGNVRELESILKRALDDAFAETPSGSRDHIHVDKIYFERQIDGPKEEELKEVEQFLTELEVDAQLAVETLKIFPVDLKQRHLEDVTQKKNYRQKIDNFFKIGKREEVTRILFAREYEKWPLIRHIRPFKTLK